MKAWQFVPAWKQLDCNNCGSKAGELCTRVILDVRLRWPIPCAARKLAAAPPPRVWYVAPFRCWPGSIIDTAVVEHNVCVLPVALLRGGVLTAVEAAKVADAWRAEGKRSPLWLVLVEQHRVTHCQRYLSPEDLR